MIASKSSNECFVWRPTKVGFAGGCCGAGRGHRGPECDYTPTTPDQEVLQGSYPEPLQEEAKKEMEEEPTKNSKDEEDCGGTAGWA